MVQLWFRIRGNTYQSTSSSWPNRDESRLHLDQGSVLIAGVPRIDDLFDCQTCPLVNEPLLASRVIISLFLIQKLKIQMYSQDVVCVVDND